ncbi:MAG: YicC family protein [Crocinitomicaceae bacterium]|nr:YicC family protein [Crocinitomicaceae bacterium]
MLHSMTGYGKATGTFEGKKVSIEIKALNSKSMDLYIRIASSYREKELEMRQKITSMLDRGKVEANVVIESTGASKSVEINKDLATAYFNDLKKTNEIVNQSDIDYMALILKMPDIFIQSKEEITAEEAAFLNDLMEEACNHLNVFRRQEGVALEKEFTERINEIKNLLSRVPEYENLRIDTIRDRMKKGLEEIQAVNYDENRFQQELIYYIEKLDVSEEKMRLSNHLDYFLETMVLPAAGKKLGFITQEIGREINTLGSKSYHVELQKIVVEMKDSLEKIKEQVLNTL